MSTHDPDRSPRRFTPAEECSAFLPDVLDAEHVSVWSSDRWDRELLFTLDTETGLATVEVVGPLDARAAWYWDGYAGESGVEARVTAALRDDRVRAVLLRVDSPGGACAGLFECCDAIRAAKGSKPVVAFADGAGAYSAGYTLAATADEVFVSRTSGVGSVGVIATVYSYAGQLAKDGITPVVVSSGKLKADLHPALPIEEAAVKRLRGRVMALAELLAGDVGRARRMGADDVLALQAGCFYGPEAVSSGLADRVGTVSDAAERALALAAQRAAKAAKEQSMSALRTAFGLSAEATESDIEAKGVALAKHASGIAALVGGTDDASTYAAVAALKTNAARADELARENATLRGAAEASSRGALLAKARAEGKVTPADEADAEWSAMVAAMPTAQLRTFLARLRPAVPTTAHEHAETEATGDQSFSETDAHFASRAGLTREQFIEQRRRDRAEAQKGSR